mmetsp:Transcript_116289/g.276418  ORF Transcript_116289/g.276418 Transcript_116289/m.276418 type:complete len:306 (-) Transcript_116289:2812-3729(-)
MPPVLCSQVQGDLKVPARSWAVDGELQVGTTSMERRSVYDDLAGETTDLPRVEDPSAVTVNGNLEVEAERARLLVELLPDVDHASEDPRTGVHRHRGRKSSRLNDRVGMSSPTLDAFPLPGTPGRSSEGPHCHLTVLHVERELNLVVGHALHLEVATAAILVGPACLLATARGKRECGINCLQLVPLLQDMEIFAAALANPEGGGPLLEVLLIHALHSHVAPLGEAPRNKVAGSPRQGQHPPLLADFLPCDRHPVHAELEGDLDDGSRTHLRVTPVNAPPLALLVDSRTFNCYDLPCSVHSWEER